jgi:hypothetical protein
VSGARSKRIEEALKVPSRPIYAVNFDNRSRYRKVDLSSAWR